MGKYVESLPKNSPLLQQYPVSQEFFVIYINTSAFIGQIENEDVRRKIISTYTKARGLVDSFRMNNDIIIRYENAVWQAQVSVNTPQQQFFTNQVADFLRRAITYADDIKSAHAELKSEVDDLLRELDKRLRPR